MLTCGTLKMSEYCISVVSLDYKKQVNTMRLVFGGSEPSHEYQRVGLEMALNE